MKRGYADTLEGQIHYTVDGTGEPLLLLHQTGSSRTFYKLIPLLSKEYRVFAPDNLGEGNSDRLPPNFEIRDMARSYIHFMDALDIEKTHIFGFHTGNKIGTELSAGWPSRVDGLILCGQTHSIQADHKDQVAVMGAMERPELVVPSNPDRGDLLMASERAAPEAREPDSGPASNTSVFCGEKGSVPLGTRSYTRRELIPRPPT